MLFDDLDHLVASSEAVLPFTGLKNDLTLTWPRRFAQSFGFDRGEG
jgi:hypothetical protein